ncbi:MAG: HPF/RaiA family ribosome-associated protein [Gammaproteobacteria bacterium]|nr:HPF/RaiA family ribosome-associated protein [Gammaproteobacteria bacterium]
MAFKIQLNTDNHIDGTDSLEERVNAMLEQHLGRYFPRLTRIEVFLSDLNSIKSGPDDKRCALEARLKNDDPVAASHDDENVEKAIRGACDKLSTILDARIEKQRGY